MKSKGEQRVVVLGLLPCFGSGNGLDVIWWTVSSSARSGDLFVVVIVCQKHPHSPSSKDGGDNEQDIVVRVKKCVAGNKRKRIIDQLTVLKRLCEQNKIEMDVKLVGGGENPDKVMLEQANTYRASTLVISNSERFITWRKKSRPNFFVQNAPSGCSVVVVRNGKIVRYKDCENKENLYIKTGNTQPSPVTDPVAACESKTRELCVCINEASHERKFNENSVQEELKEILQHDKEDIVNVDEKRRSSVCTEVINVFFDVNGEDEEGQCVQQNIKTKTVSESESQVFEVYFEVKDEETEIADDIGHVNIPESSERDECGKAWSRQSQDSSPRGVLDGPVSCIDSDSSSFSDKLPTASPSHWNGESGEKGPNWRSMLRTWKQKSMLRMSSFSTPRLSWGNSEDFINSKRTYSFPHRQATKDGSSICGHLSNLEKALTDSCSKPTWRCFTLKELECATSYFSPDNLIGKGGYAEVYKGYLANGQIVAVKRLNRSHTEEQRIGDFLTELGIIVHINHPNTAHLIGFGIEGGLHIILQFSPHGSLASILHGPNPQILSWDIRHRVALGIAKGLSYLHEGCQRRIIHRDIKASNILLTEEFEPQISDFGLAKWLPSQWAHLTATPIEGTFGYLAPEYFMHGIIDEKTDVFAFGVLLLELITGHHPIDSSQQSLVMWAMPLIDNKSIRELADPCLGDAYNMQQMTCLAMTAGQCVHQSSLLRPCMAEVLQMLIDERDKMEIGESWRLPLFQPFLLEESSDTDEYTSTRYLSDLDRHKEIALQF